MNSYNTNANRRRSNRDGHSSVNAHIKSSVTVALNDNALRRTNGYLLRDLADYISLLLHNITIIKSLANLLRHNTRDINKIINMRARISNNNLISNHIRDDLIRRTQFQVQLQLNNDFRLKSNILGDTRYNVRVLLNNILIIRRLLYDLRYLNRDFPQINHMVNLLRLTYLIRYDLRINLIRLGQT